MEFPLPSRPAVDLTWKYLDQSVMIDVDQRQCETMTRLMRRAVWPAQVSQPADPATSYSPPKLLAPLTSELQRRKFAKYFPNYRADLPAGCELFTNPRWTKYQHWQRYNRAVTGCCIMGSEGLVRTSGNYNALIGFSIEQGAEHQPSKTPRLRVKEVCLRSSCAIQ